MEVFIIVLAILFVLFAFVILFGAPYLPTMNKQAAEALKLLDLKSGQTLLDLGSGDGRVLRMAARHGIRTTGYELNPLLVIVSMFICLKERRLVTIKLRNFWSVNCGEADAIYVFLLKRYMPKLDKKIIQEITHPVKVVSFAFAFPDRKPLKQSGGLMLYEFKPAKK